MEIIITIIIIEPYSSVRIKSRLRAGQTSGFFPIFSALQKFRNFCRTNVAVFLLETSRNITGTRLC